MDITPPPKKPVLKTGDPASSAMPAISAMMIIPIIIGVIIAFIFHYGAARLSYNTYGSYGWSFLAFLFAVFYYPYYAFFVSKPASFFGGKRR